MRASSLPVFVLLSIACRPVVAGEPASKILIDNDKVVVSELRYGPGDAIGMSERPARVVRALNDSTMDLQRPDGRKETVRWKTGDVKYFPKERIANGNIGKADAVFFITAIK